MNLALIKSGNRNDDISLQPAIMNNDFSRLDDSGVSPHLNVSMLMAKWMN